MFRSVFFSVAALAVMSYAASNYLAGRFNAQPPQQASLESAPADPVPQPQGSGSGYDEIQLAPDASGNYLTDVDIDGHLIRMIVDTGATYVSLTNEDANAIGINPAPAEYRYRTMTANGVGVAAKVNIPRLRLQQMEIYDVEAFVMPQGALHTSLLGMSALSHLAKVEISGGRPVLRQ
jgi:aspartyl protease family protein